MRAEGKSEAFTDRLALDLATACFLCSPMPDMVERIRSELAAVRDVLIRMFPDSAIVLTGSMFVGEGQVDFVSGYPVIRSDYDLYVVSPNLGFLLPPVARQNLLSTLDAMPLSTQLDISLVWKLMLRMRMTTIGGAVIGGTLDISKILPFLPAPSAGSALLRAYRFLSAAPLFPERYELLCAKGLTRGAQALLLHEAKGRPRRQWIGLSSLAFVRKAIVGAESQIGADAVDTIQHACDTVLGAGSGCFSAEDHSRYATILGSIADRIPLLSSKTQALKHALWLMREKRLGIPRLSTGTTILQGLRILTESWRLGQLDHESIRRTELLARSLYCIRHAYSDTDTRATYVGVRGLLTSLTNFNPNKLYYGQRGVPI